MASILIVWTDIPPEVESDFNNWYNHQHMPDRVGRLPGFLRGRRYVATPVVAGAPKYLTLYDLSDAALMMSPAHVALRRQRPARDLQFVPLFRNTIKGICDVAARAGYTCGVSADSHLVVLPVSAREPDFASRVASGLLPHLALLPGVLGATVAMRNVEVTAASSAKDDRAGDRYVDGLIAAELADVNAAPLVASSLAPKRLAALGGVRQLVDDPVVLRLIHDLQYSPNLIK